MENEATRDRTVDDGEIAKFAAMAEEWWDPDGKFRPLHRLNPVRLEFLRDRIADRFGRDTRADRPLAGLTVLDVGCGGGLLCEPMARLGAAVTGIDAGAGNVEIARAHAEAMGLSIDYRFAAAADLSAAGRTFDVVLNMEVIEHVADRDAFLCDCARLVRPGGLMFLATLNRTPKAYLLAIVGAEYVLRWLPRGTHAWRRFVRPSEMAASLRRAGMTMTELAGIVYDPPKDGWKLAPHDLDVNYMAVAAKPGQD
ncbi:MAG: bifunctional 2-polyprenyl-6-hydroxyphenol methylase/3-demethylubiquinol 3-O-methyltransferase UbiG [Alphaproteobacteria bacterium]|nr:bifunctional 2-polyprenyl-6-hydroxyphenol methylase/3-demethylubiquinol 3-O-methyltransferase UbiG [Alphaproteobacteria bacterium]